MELTPPQVSPASWDHPSFYLSPQAQDSGEPPRSGVRAVGDSWVIYGGEGKQQGWGSSGNTLDTHNMKSCSQEGRLPRTAMVVLLTFCTFRVT